jgi:hypothetical protein
VHRGIVAPPPDNYVGNPSIPEGAGMSHRSGLYPKHPKPGFGLRFCS